MRLGRPTLLRIGSAIAFAAVIASWILVSYGHLPAKVHATLIGVFAAIFATCESFFRSLLSDLNATLRSSVLSIAQKERMFARVQPAKRRLLRNSIFLIGLKILAALSAAYLVAADPDDTMKLVAIIVGYGSILVSLPIMCVIYWNWQKVDSFLDSLSMIDTEKKEKEKLLKEFESGQKLPQEGDLQFKGYTSLGTWDKASHP